MSENKKPFVAMVPVQVEVFRPFIVEPCDIAFTEEGGAVEANGVFQFIVQLDNFAQDWELTQRLADHFNGLLAGRARTRE